jgi:hypothetical protein
VAVSTSTAQWDSFFSLTRECRDQEALALTSILSQYERGGFSEILLFYLRGKAKKEAEKIRGRFLRKWR